MPSSKHSQATSVGPTKRKTRESGFRVKKRIATQMAEQNTVQDTRKDDASQLMKSRDTPVSVQNQQHRADLLPANHETQM
jgi:hypothetical protein